MLPGGPSSSRLLAGTAVAATAAVAVPLGAASPHALRRVAPAAPHSSFSALSPLVCARRGIIVPKQLKAYGGSFSESRGERNDHLAGHLTLRPLKPRGKDGGPIGGKSLLARPVRTAAIDSFEAIPGLSPVVQAAAASEALQLRVPSPIQQIGIDTILQDKNTLLLAPHGAGKTMAYLLPLFQKMINDKRVYKIPLRERRPRMVVLAHTRENIEQIVHTCNRLNEAIQQQVRAQPAAAAAAAMTADNTNITTIGFTSRKRSNYHLSRLLKRGAADVVVMDPKTILKLLRSRRLFLDDLRYVVVDEADLLLSSQHDHQANVLISKVMRRNRYLHLWPVQTQFVFASSFMTRKLEYFLGNRFPDASPPPLLPSATDAPPQQQQQLLASSSSTSSAGNIIFNNRHVDKRVVPCFVKDEMHRASETLRHKFVAVTRTEEKKDVLFHLLRKHRHRPVVDPNSDEMQERLRRGASGGGGGGSGKRSVGPDLTLSGTLEEWRREHARELADPHSLLEEGGGARAAVATREAAAAVSVQQKQQQEKEEEVPTTAERHLMEHVTPTRWEHLSTTAAPFLCPHRRRVFAPGHRTVVFFNTVDAATAFYHYLREEGGFACSLLHGALPVAARRAHYRAFGEGRTNILCATDVAARGLDLPVDVVINFEVPGNPPAYLARCGRAGRMHRRGVVYSLYHRKRDKTVADALRLFTNPRYAVAGRGGTASFSDAGINRGNEAALSKPRYAEWRSQRINSLARAYTSLITRKTIPHYLERTYVRHNALWRPVYHPRTLAAGTKNSHGGVPPAQQQRIMDSVMSQAVDFRKQQLARRKGGRAKFGSRRASGGVWNDVGAMSMHASGGSGGFGGDGDDPNLGGGTAYRGPVNGIPAGPPRD